MLNSDLPEDLRDMPRGLLIAVLGIDMDERRFTGTLSEARASLQASLDAIGAIEAARACPACAGGMPMHQMSAPLQAMHATHKSESADAERPL